MREARKNNRNNNILEIGTTAPDQGQLSRCTRLMSLGYAYAVLCCAVLFEAVIIDSHIAWSGGGETGWRRDGEQRTCSMHRHADDDVDAT